MKWNYQAITEHHQSRPAGNQHLDTLSWSSEHSRALESETICQKVGPSPRLPPAPYTSPRLQPVALLEPLLRSEGHQESPSQKAGRRDPGCGKLQLCPWLFSRRPSRETLQHLWRHQQNWMLYYFEEEECGRYFCILLKILLSWPSSLRLLALQTSENPNQVFPANHDHHHVFFNRPSHF